MTKRYSVADARAALASILDEVEAGETVEVTRRGKPAAVIVSRWLFDRMEPRKTFAEAFAAWRERYDLEEIGITDEFDDLRSKEPGRPVDL